MASIIHRSSQLKKIWIVIVIPWVNVMRENYRFLCTHQPAPNRVTVTARFSSETANQRECMPKVLNSRPISVAIIAITALVVIEWLWHAYGPDLELNFSASAPRGLYQIVPIEQWQRGTWIVLELPPETWNELGERSWLKPGTTLIKPIGALPGERVCATDSEITIEGKPIGSVAGADFEGLPLPQLRGCFTVPEDAILPLSSHSPRSFDGRYFGPIPKELVLGEAVPIFTID